MSERLEIYPDADALARAAADHLLKMAGEAVAARGLFTLALAGGSTPKKLYALLATQPVYRAFPWVKTQIFLSDERHVPLDHPESNYLMAEKTLFSSGLVPKENIHPIEAGLADAGAAAANYEEELKKTFGSDTLLLDGFPRFDAILLGMGPDGHTASLFPGTTGLAEKTHWVVAHRVEKLNTDRITFTYPVLDAARAALLLIAGTDKAEMIHEVRVTQAGKTTYPVQGVQLKDGVKLWMLDEAAAAQLPPEQR